MSGDSNLEKHQPIGIDSRDPSKVLKASAPPPETFSLSNLSHLAFFAHANVFHHGGQPVPIELSIASIPEDGKDPKVICITVDHSNLLTTAKDSRANRYINERLSLKSHLLGSVPLEYLDFCVRGKFCHLAQGNSGLIVVKGSDQRKNFEKLGLFTINLEILPHFRDLNDRTLPDHLHDEVHEDYDISECTMVKSYRFARYLQHFNKLQAECKRQTDHLVEKGIYINGSSRSNPGKSRSSRKPSSDESKSRKSNKGAAGLEDLRLKRKVGSKGTTEGNDRKQSKICRKRSVQGSEQRDRKRQAPVLTQGIKRTIPSSVSSRKHKYRRNNFNPSQGPETISGQYHQQQMGTFIQTKEGSRRGARV
ncbi:uncharacterized protein TNCV_3207491 [Trichonephila clavipes]|nr:uncharacterized protein TNCV_3207491 [Trichonephila clavipes]